MANKNYWDATHKILLVVKFESLDKIHAYRSAIKDVQLNVNDCAVLALCPTKKESSMLTEIHSVVYGSEQEINLLGRWKNEDVNKALARFYDLVLVIGDISPKVGRHISKVKNTISVGVNTNVDFLTIDLKTEQTSPAHLLNFVKQTLGKII